MGGTGTFVYTPDVRVLVAASEGVIDVSRDIVDFNINRITNGISQFSCSLSNQYQKYDRKLPRMARVIVFLKRVEWMQVFAGYLDSVPIRTVVPGNVRITASCSIKRLQFSQWDPTVPEHQKLLPGLFQGPAWANMDDGGAAKAIYNVLTEICNWDPNHVHLQRIPQAFMDHAVRIANTIKPDVEAQRERDNLMLGSGYTGGVDANVGSLDVSGIGAVATPGQLAALAHNAGFRGEDIAVAVAVALAESGGEVNIDNAGTNRNGSVDYGLWQINARAHGPAGFDPVKGKQDASYNAMWAKKVYDGAGGSFRPWATYWSNPYKSGLGQGKHLKHMDVARSAAASLTSGGQVQANVESGVQSMMGGFYKQPGGDGAAAPVDVGAQGIIIPVAGVTKKQLTDTFGAPRSGGRRHKGIDIFAKKGTPVIAAVGGHVTRASNGGGLGGNRVWITGDRNGWHYYYAHLDTIAVQPGTAVRAGQTLGTVGNTGLEAVRTPDHLHFSINKVAETEDRAHPGNNVNPHTFLTSGQAETLDDGTLAPTGTDSSFNIIYRAWAPVSTLFRKDRAFLNAQSVLTTVQMLAKASMREFQSAPNGDFVAFFPDWFGLWGLTPTMDIEDIELIDFKLNAEDGPLATHVGVSGDTYAINPDGTFSGVVDVLDWVDSRGIITIEQEEVMGLLMGTEGPPDFDIKGFLNRFGMRPKVEEIAEVRDHRWETLYALQVFMKQWTLQYKSPVQLTFMPEVYPGMRLRLVNHDMIVYVESVTHQGSRSGGFTTSVEVSCPVTESGGLLPLELVRR